MVGGTIFESTLVGRCPCFGTARITAGFVGHTKVLGVATTTACQSCLDRVGIGGFRVINIQSTTIYSATTLLRTKSAMVFSKATSHDSGKKETKNDNVISWLVEEDRSLLCMYLNGVDYLVDCTFVDGEDRVDDFLLDCMLRTFSTLILYYS
jgi:hypothetical protein